jgi:broad specificity phosphatase PhoE
MERIDIPYDVPPGPALTAEGEAQARLVGEYLLPLRIARLYSSHFLRAKQTAAIAADQLGLTVHIERGISEWHASERARDVVARVEPVLERIKQESESEGPVCLVSHGGPIGVMLRKLGMNREQVDAYRSTFGGSTPSPHAGIWRVTANEGRWEYALVFQPLKSGS